MAQQHKAYQPDQAEGDEVYGNLDTKNEHPFPKGWIGRVVVRQVDVQLMNSGTYQEDLGTVKVMNYEIETYEALERKNLFGKNTKVTILHDPR